jgi:hypothetical protein
VVGGGEGGGDVGREPLKVEDGRGVVPGKW